MLKNSLPLWKKVSIIVELTMGPGAPNGPEGPLAPYKNT